MAVTAIIKPTHACNFSCTYCYMDESAEKGFLSDETLENIIEQVTYVNKLRNSDPKFIWHGGEPLLMKKDFYEKLLEFQRKHNHNELDLFRLTLDNETYLLISDKVRSARNSVQSNGSLITDEIAAYFKEKSISIGLSLDGPGEINDLTRQYSDGKGSYDSVISGLRLCKEKQIGGGIITVLNKNNIDKMDELYDFYKENNLSPKINPLIKSGNAEKNYEDLGITPKEYGQALITLFDKWYYDKDTKISIDPLDEMIGNIYSKDTKSCNFSNNCQESFVSIGPQGDIYPCGRFDGIQEFKLGNINKDSLNEILDSDLRKSLLSRNHLDIAGCAKCEYGDICHGGCMHNAYMHTGNIMDKDYYCQSYKMIFSHIKNEISKEISV